VVSSSSVGNQNTVSTGTANFVSSSSVENLPTNPRLKPGKFYNNRLNTNHHLKKTFSVTNPHNCKHLILNLWNFSIPINGSVEDFDLFPCQKKIELKNLWVYHSKEEFFLIIPIIS
jgi:hypothetical protein